MCNRIGKKKKDESVYFLNSVLLNALGLWLKITECPLFVVVSSRRYTVGLHIQLVAESSRTW